METINPKRAKNQFTIVGIFFLVILLINIIPILIAVSIDTYKEYKDRNIFIILSSYENKDFENQVIDYGKKNKINVKFEYASDLEIIDILNSNSSDYDAVWISNSIWLYMLDNSYLVSESKSISINPVVMGIKKSKAVELGFVNSDIYNRDLLQAIQNKSLNYIMPSVTKTNSGATAYLGFLNSLAGNPEVLTEEILDNPNLSTSMIQFFSGVSRVSGDESYLEEMFLNSSEYEAIITSETSLIRINQALVKSGKEPLYLIYPIDGVAINDSPFAYINNNQNKKENFTIIQQYLLSEEGQKKLQKLGRRTWYGGTNKNADTNIFNPEWGIDTTKYLIPLKYPSKSVMTFAFNLYIEEFRKPSYTIFCLDFSGSMAGEGDSELKAAMNYILNYTEASKDMIQFSKHDTIVIIPFASYVQQPDIATNGRATDTLLINLNKLSPNGGTNLYGAVNNALSMMNDVDGDKYTKTIILMTDGEGNIGSYYDVYDTFTRLNSNVPIYSITFGNAMESQLEELANLSNAKVFDGKTDLLTAFKEVRSYN